MNRQKYLHKSGLLVFLGVLSMTAPLATDMYLPSFPTIAIELNTSSSMVSMTLVVFNLFSALGVLWFGPVSDKYGRKKSLLASLFLYLFGNIGCFICPTIEFFIAVRAFQAFGAGGMMSLSLAIVKDFYTGPNRGKIIAILQSFTIFAPVLAPLLGALIVQFVSWRYVFMLLIIISILELVCGFLFEETIPSNEVYKGKLIKSFSRIFVVAKNIKFTIFLLVGSLFFACFFSYLSLGSFIYEDFFALDETQFSLCFATTAALSLLGPVLSVVMEKRLKFKFSVNILFVFGFISIILVFTIGQTSPIAFLASFTIYAVANSIFRPYCTNKLLDMHDGDTGSATSFLNFIFTILGTIGMLACDLPTPNYVITEAICMIFFVGLAFIIWAFSARLYKSN